MSDDNRANDNDADGQADEDRLPWLEAVEEDGDGDGGGTAGTSGHDSGSAREIPVYTPPSVPLVEAVTMRAVIHGAHRPPFDTRV